jgi:hypothetical protein
VIFNGIELIAGKESRYPNLIQEMADVLGCVDLFVFNQSYSTLSTTSPYCRPLPKYERLSPIDPISA